MFDVGFSEILVIMLVSLVVIGPERLPKVARTMGNMWGRTQRYVNRIKQDVSSTELEELREVERKVKAEADALQLSAQQVGNRIEHDLRQLERDLDQPVRDMKQAALSSGANTSSSPSQ